jgi:hypothetical protein
MDGHVRAHTCDSAGAVGSDEVECSLQGGRHGRAERIVARQPQPRRLLYADTLYTLRGFWPGQRACISQVP